MSGTTEALVAIGIVAAAAGIYLACTIEPVYIFTLAIVLTPFSGNWADLHVPAGAAPDRLLFVVGTIVVLARSFVLGTLPKPRFGVSHAVIALAVCYAAVSAESSHALVHKAPGLLLLDTFGVLPFISFWLAPVVFPTARERSILLGALVALGAYLGLTALFETTGPKALVWPRYILNPAVGIHYGRARGPFVDAVANGVGLYVGAIAAAIATVQWRKRLWGVLAACIGALCLAGTIMTLERSVWIAAAAATLVALLASRFTRRIAVPSVLGVVAVAAIVIFTVPGLRSSVTHRLHSSQSIYDRENLLRTGLNMVDARPLLGFGWDQYQADHIPYIQQSGNIPLTAINADLSDVYLEYAVELGLIGATLWLLAVLLGVGGTALTRAPPALEPWRLGLVALLVFFLISEAAVPPTVFVNAILWLWAGVAAVTRYPPVVPRREEAVSAGLTGRPSRGGGPYAGARGATRETV